MFLVGHGGKHVSYRCDRKSDQGTDLTPLFLYSRLESKFHLEKNKYFNWPFDYQNVKIFFFPLEQNFGWFLKQLTKPQASCSDPASRSTLNSVLLILKSVYGCVDALVFCKHDALCRLKYPQYAIAWLFLENFLRLQA